MGFVYEKHEAILIQKKLVGSGGSAISIVLWTMACGGLLGLFELTALAASPLSCSGGFERIHYALVEGPESLVSQVPRPFALEAKLLRPNAPMLTQLFKGEVEAVSYVVTADGLLYFTEQPLKQAIAGEGGAAGAAHYFVEIPGAQGREVMAVKEAGVIRYTEFDEKKPAVFFIKRKSRKAFVFEQVYGVDLADVEMRDIDRQLRAIADADVSSARVARNGIEKSRVLDCTEVMSKRLRGDSFILDRIATDLTLLTGGIALSAPERFFGEGGYDLLGADYASTSEHSLLRATVGLMVATGGMKAAQRYGIRLGTAGASVLIQSAIYGALTDQSAKSFGIYNAAYALFSIPKADILDRVLLRKLPGLAYEACLKNSPLQIFVSPRAVRFAEGLASVVIYLEGRKIFVEDKKGDAHQPPKL